MEKEKLLITFIGREFAKKDSGIIKLIEETLPKKVIIFLSGEELDADKVDDEKRELLLLEREELLISSQKSVNDISIEYISLGNENPATFSDFNINQNLNEIFKKYEEQYDIIYNVSTGTPQLRIALCLDILLNYRKGQAYQVMRQDDYCLSVVSKTDLFSFYFNSIKKELLSAIQTKSYAEVLKLLKTDENSNNSFYSLFNKDKEIYELANYANKCDKLVDMDNNEIKKILNIYPNFYRFKDFNKIEYEYENKLINYFISWDNVYRKGNYNNLLLKMTPLFYNILKYILFENLYKKGIFNHKRIDKNSNQELQRLYKHDRFNKEVLYESLGIPLNNKNNVGDTFARSMDLIEILDYYKINQQYGFVDKGQKVTLIEEIRNKEREIRNLLAHELLVELKKSSIQSTAIFVHKSISFIFKKVFEDKKLDSRINYDFFEQLEAKIIEKIVSLHK